MGRGTSKIARNSVLGKGKETSEWWNGKRTHLEATAGNEKGTLILGKPKNIDYDEQTATFSHGFVNEANNSMRGYWKGINWDNVKKVEGQTFYIKEDLKERGFKWDRDEKAWVKK